MNQPVKTTFKFLLLFILVTTQSSLPAAQIIVPEKVYRIVYEIQTDEWYQQQAVLWKKEIDKNPQNAEAWMNYYNANRYANFDNVKSQDRQEKLNRIIEDMGKVIPGSYEYYILKFKTDSDLNNMSLIEKAYALDPARPDAYYDLLTWYALKGDESKFDEFCAKLYRSKDIAPWLMSYNYNVLMSTEANAILITNGDNDTYPAWLLQRVKGIRPDVSILNISLTSIQSYFENAVKSKKIVLDYETIQTRAKQKGAAYFPAALIQELVPELTKKYPQYPVYFALTVYSNYIEPFKENLYAVGLAFRYNEKRMDNLALIKKNLEQNFTLDYLKFDYPGDQYPGKRLAAKMNLNYISPIMLLAEHYYLSGDQEKAQQWKKFALNLAETAGNKEAEDEINNTF
jgi:hypothetical protein